MNGMSLTTASGARKYINAAEREAFLSAAEKSPHEVRTLCMVIAYFGCRVPVRQSSF